MMETTIHRRHKHEAELAIEDLKKRGFYEVFPLAEKKAVTTSRGNYNYRRGKYETVGSGIASAWICKMRKDD